MSRRCRAWSGKRRPRNHRRREQPDCAFARRPASRRTPKSARAPEGPSATRRRMLRPAGRSDPDENPAAFATVDGVRALDGVGGQVRGCDHVAGVTGRRKQRRADDDQRRGMCADRTLEWLGAVGLRQRRLARTGAAQRYAFVDQEVVAAVDEEGAGCELHHLPGRARVDAGLDPCRVVLRCALRRAAGRQRGADLGADRDAARAHHPGVPDRGPLGRKEGSRVIDGGGRRRFRFVAGRG